MTRTYTNTTHPMREVQFTLEDGIIKVPLSDLLLDWLDEYEKNQEVVIMSWNECESILEDEVWEAWKGMEGDLGDTDTVLYTFIPHLQHMIELRDEVTQLARYEEDEV